MAAKSTAFETDLLKLILNNVALANIGDAGGLQPSVGAGSLYIGLCTADPGVGGDQTTNEISYTGYSRVAVARDGTQWTVAAGSATNNNTILFGTMTAGAGGTVTYFSVGTDSGGVGHLLYRGTITSPVAGLAVTAGIAPEFVASSMTITES